MGETLAPRVVRSMKVPIKERCLSRSGARQGVVPVKELINGLKMDYKKTTNYQQMWHARDLVRDWYLGGHRKSFHMIPSLMARIQEVDPSAIVDSSNQDGTQNFNKAFICPFVTRSALNYSQPLVCLYVCHTKN